MTWWKAALKWVGQTLLKAAETEVEKKLAERKAKAKP